MKKKITILLADDHTIVREGFRLLLELEPDIEVAGEAVNGREAVALGRKLQPDVIVMDVSMPLLNGIEATRQLRKSCPDTRVLVLSAHGDDAYVEQMMELGAAGFLLKQSSSLELATAIRTVRAGGIFLSPDLARRHRDRRRATISRDGGHKPANIRLSSREMEVLQLIAEGKANKQVAAELGIAFKTADKHRQHIMGKLDIHDVASLTRYAIAEGIIENDVRPGLI